MVSAVNLIARGCLVHDVVVQQTALDYHRVHTAQLAGKIREGALTVCHNVVIGVSLGSHDSVLFGQRNAFLFSREKSLKGRHIILRESLGCVSISTCLTDGRKDFVGNPALEGLGFSLARTENEGIQAGFVDNATIPT